jgi:hypothetical protein
VFPCISYSRPLGRLRDTGMRLTPIWNGESVVATQREIWNGDCPQCWTACEAYHTILGNLSRPFAGPSTPGVSVDSSNARRLPLTRIGD